MAGAHIRVLDATLREGNQAPGVRWDAATSVEIARGLDALGIDTVECGHPVVGEGERARIRAVLAAGLVAPVLVHARALAEDVDAAADVGAPWVGIFLGVGELSRRSRVRRTIPELHDMIAASIDRARARGLRVRFTLEDATRTDPDDALRAYRVAAEAGADRLGLADTAGCAEPAEIATRTAALRRALPDLPVEVHLHDDRGLAVAGAIAAVDAGATWIATSILGLGERCGIPDLAAVLANLAHRDQRPWPDGPRLQALARRAAEIAGGAPDPRRPVIGAHAFTHRAKLHVTAMRRDPESYSWVPAERVGRRVELVERERDDDAVEVRPPSAAPLRGD